MENYLKLQLGVYMQVSDRSLSLPQEPSSVAPGTKFKKVKTPRNLRDGAKITKTIRSGVKLIETVTDTEISNSVKLILKSTKVVKYYKVITKSGKIPASYERFKNADEWNRKAKALAYLVKLSRSSLACTVSAINLLEDTNFICPIIPVGPLRIFKTINLLAKPSSLYIASSSLVKTTKLHSSLKSLQTGLLTTSDKQKAVSQSLLTLAPMAKRLQKKLGLDAKKPLKEELSVIREQLESGRANTAVTDTKKLLDNLAFKTKVLCACKAVRTVAKVGVIAGNLLAFLYPEAGRIVVCSAVMVTFSNWAIQKYMFPR